MHEVEDATVESLDVPPVRDIGQEDSPVIVLIIDAVDVLQSMTKTPNMLKISHLQDAFNKRIETVTASYDEGCVVRSILESVVEEQDPAEAINHIH